MKILIWLISVIVIAAGGFIVGTKYNRGELAPLILSSPTPVPTPLSRYSIENLANAPIKPGKFEIVETLEENDKFTAYKFRLTFDPEIDSGKFKSTTGQLNIPRPQDDKQQTTYPLVLMFRGYVDRTLFTTGIGTRSGAKVFAENGFITVALDYLGYGDSDSEAGNIFESRFQTYTTSLSMLKALDQIEEWNGDDVFFWAHSNGGQIALTVLEATGADYPTTLWAPVTKPFPYSVLYYTDESEDRGKFIRKELARFEELYNPDLFAITDYLDRINAPLQLHQGTNDDAIPVDWSNEFNAQLESAEVDVEYFVYPGADHNLRPAWDEVIQKDVEFFRQHL